MAKTKTPFFGLGSQGSIGNTLTTQKRPGTTMVRVKPTPGYRRTLPQLYQRWLYQDYAHYWTQQSAATRAEYRSAGSRFHLTGFQYWMKVQLAGLSAIASWWKLDEPSGAIAHDSSRNANHGTIFGPSPTTGLIDGCYLFDGLNDYIDCGTDPSLNFTTALTIEAFVKPASNGTFISIVSKGSGQGLPNVNTFLFIRFNTNLLAFSGQDGGWVFSTTPILSPNWYHITVTYDGSNVRFYINGVLSGSPAVAYSSLVPVADTLRIGRQGSSFNWWDGLIDNLIINNRTLDNTEILRHSKRRYPS